MKIIKIVGLVGLIIIPNLVIANETAISVRIVSLSNWVGTANYPNEVLIVRTNETQLTNPAKCTRLDGYHLDAASKISRSMLLTAFTTKTNTNLVIYGGGCSIDDRPLIAAITLVD